MRVGGNSKLVKRVGTVTLRSGGDEVVLVLSALPLGWRDRISQTKAFQLPQPPKNVLKDKKGKVLRDADGTALIERDEEDHEYRMATAEVGLRFRAVKIFEHLKDDQQVQFSAQEPVSNSTEEWVKFSADVLGELVEFGFTEAELAAIDVAGDKLSLRVDIEKFSADFLSEGKEE